MDTLNLKIPALGRTFTLGMLYDARKDALIPGLTLWDVKTLQDKISVSPHQNSVFQIAKSDSTDSKSSLLDVNASLKASFLGGLVEVGGSAKYLNDKKKSRNQSRVTCQYKATTNFKQLLVSNLKAEEAEQLNLIKQGSATHVVTGIKYGASAVFVFDSEKLESSRVQDIGGSMEAVIKKIPSFSIEGRVDIKLSDAEKAVTDKFSCKFYGDFILESNPATFVDAVKTYAELPKLLGKDGENSVPMEVWLMPLTHFEPGAAEVKKEISTGLLRKVEDALEGLTKTKMRCYDILDEVVVENCPHIKEELNRFKKLCGDYEYNLKKTMAKTLPSIRAGEEDESSVEKFLEDGDKSPFSNEKLRKWMDHKEREINVIRACVDIMGGIKIAKNQSELDREVLASGAENALCFVFTYLEGGNPCLGVMAKYLDSSEVEHYNEDLWYYSDEVRKIREKAKGFNDVAKALKNNKRFRFLVASLPNKKYRGATIYQYKNGNLVTEDFSKPDPPAVETITNRSDLIWYACDLNLDPNTASNWLHLSEGNKMATCGPWQSDLPDNPERFDKNPQVLCKEGLTGQHYWQVEMSSGSDQSIHVAVAYKGVGRKGTSWESELGTNTKSWSLGKTFKSVPFQIIVKAYHIDCVWSTHTDLTRVGVYLDWPAGTLSFYSVSANTLSHLYTFRTKFTEPLYPGFYVRYQGNYAHLNLDE